MVYHRFDLCDAAPKNPRFSAALALATAVVAGYLQFRPAMSSRAVSWRMVQRFLVVQVTASLALHGERQWILKGNF
jgi:hypothetical protein